MAKDSLDELLEQAEETLEKGGDLGEIETEHHGRVKPETTKKHDVEEEIKQARMEKNEASEASDAEDEIVEEKADTKTKEEKTKKTKKTKKGKAKVRGAKYIKALDLVDRNKKYDIADALELVKKTSLTKFDGNVEIHIRLQGKSGKPEQIRGMIQYPFATGKKTTVVILNDAMIEEISKTGQAPADIYLTTPADMPKVARLAKILGPKGKMPNPKSGTITADPEKTQKELEGGRLEYKTDSYGIIHQIIGKVSAKDDELAQNFKAILAVLPLERITSLNLCATMGPSIKVSK